MRAILASSKFDGGLNADFFSNRNLQGKPSASSRVTKIDNIWTGSPVGGIGATDFSVRWTGEIVPSESGEYEFAARGDDGYRVFLDDKAIIDEWRDQGPFSVRATAMLAKGKTYKLRVEYYQAGGGAEMRFGWGKVNEAPYAEASQAAKEADVAIVCIGLNPAIEHEGGDRPFSLPTGQDDLVAAVLKANPNTIVLLNGGGAVDMRRWVDRAPALVMAWYPGQSGNQALAEILFGDISPSGKLPISVARRWEDCESFGNYPGADHKVDYKEGVFVGYRHFDRGKAKPLFPFGYGLSYSSFKYSKLVVEQKAFGETLVHFDVQNTGKVVADEIAQVYVTPAPAPVPRPAKELKGFLRVRLQPGEKKTLIVRLDPRAFSFFHMRKHEWEVEKGDYGVLVGSSSRDIKLRGKVTWAEKYEIGPEEDEDEDHDRKPPPR
jgi:beta-glucosidase